MYTVEIYKKDARTKKGERLVLKKDHDSILSSIHGSLVRATALRSMRLM